MGMVAGSQQIIKTMKENSAARNLVRRRNALTGVVITIAWILNGAGAAAQSLTGTVEIAQWGVSFEVPDGWTGQETEVGYVFVSKDQPGFMLVSRHEAATLDALRAEAQQGIADEGGTLLLPEGPIKTFGSTGLAADFVGTMQGEAARAYAVGLVPANGQGITALVAASPKEMSSELRAVAEHVARTAVFTPRHEAHLGQPQQKGSEEKEWVEYLKGCRLYLNNSYNSGDGSGYIDETTIDLCPNYFTISDYDFTSFGQTEAVIDDAPYIHSQGLGAGTWDVIPLDRSSVLQLRFHDGNVTRFKLGWEDGKTYLDGERWLRACDASVSVGPECH